MAFSISGLSSGLDTEQIISQLMALERRPLVLLQNRRKTYTDQLDALRQIRTDLTSLRTTLAGIVRPRDLNLFKTTSTDSSVTATASTWASPGSVTFTVDAVAASEQKVSAGSVASPSETVTADGIIGIGTGAGRLGISAVALDGAVTAGTYTVTVTGATGAATKTSDSALGSTVTITDGSTVEVTVNGTAHTLVLTGGTYTHTDLAAELARAAGAAGADIDATVSGGLVTLSTRREGSAATIQVTGGTALGDLNLSVDAGPITGTDGTVEIDGNTYTVTDTYATVTVSVGGGSGTMRFSGGLRTGSFTLHAVDVSADGSLTGVVNAINAAGAGVSASVVTVDQTVHQLRLEATGTGADRNVVFDDTELVGLGSMTTTRAASDATITLSGATPTTVTSTTNTFTGLLTGVDVTVSEVTSGEVTVTIEADAEAVADKIAEAVGSINGILALLKEKAATDPDGSDRGPLSGDSAVRFAISMIRTALAGDTTIGSPQLVGVRTDAAGNVTFNRDEFLQAWADDPDGVRRTLVQSGTGTPQGITFVQASDITVEGTYDVVVTTEARQATTVGLVGGVPATDPPTIRVRIGGVEIVYATRPSQPLSEVVEDLNALFNANDMGLWATEDAGGVRISTQAYGSAATFEVDWGDGSGYVTYTGTDIAGSIGGVTATGIGRTLTAPMDDPTVGGLVVTVTAPGTGTVGQVTYRAGVLQRVSSAVRNMVDSSMGLFTNTIDSRENTVDYLDDRIADYERRLEIRERQLRAQFTRLETMLGQLQAQQAWLSGQLTALYASLGA